MIYRQCYVEQHENGLWYVMYPDCTRAFHNGYKTKGWATRTLNWLNERSG